MYDNIRISDADRERVTSRLRDHFAEGRLNQDELDERISATLNAKTFGELQPIMADLPEPAPTGPQAGPVPTPPWTGGPAYLHRRGPRLLPVVLLIMLAAILLPGPGWAFFAFLKIALLGWLVFCVVGIFAAASFRRRARRYRRSGDNDPWSKYTGRR
jgi:Domain of unknown function (DUF1707)